MTLRYLALASVYDDTLAANRQIRPADLDAWQTPLDTVTAFAGASQRQAIQPLPWPTAGAALLCDRRSGYAPIGLRLLHTGRQLRHQHPDGDLGERRRFYFPAAQGLLQRCANNLYLFLQTVDAVDDATWEYHLQRGDYSRWRKAAITARVLIKHGQAVEGQHDLSATESRARIRAAIQQYCTLASG